MLKLSGSTAPGGHRIQDQFGQLRVGKWLGSDGDQYVSGTPNLSWPRYVSGGGTENLMIAREVA